MVELGYLLAVFGSYDVMGALDICWPPPLV